MKIINSVLQWIVQIIQLRNPATSTLKRRKKGESIFKYSGNFTQYKQEKNLPSTIPSNNTKKTLVFLASMNTKRQLQEIWEKYLNTSVWTKSCSHNTQTTQTLNWIKSYFDSYLTKLEIFKIL